MDHRVWSGSKEYIYADVSSATSPTTKPVSMAVVQRKVNPQASDFKTAEWEPGTATARLLIGPGSTFGALTAEVYTVWTKVDDDPEDPGKVSPNFLVIYDTP